MRKKIVKIGSSHGIILDKSFMELLKITPDTVFVMSTNGKDEILFKVLPNGKTK